MSYWPLYLKEAINKAILRYLERYLWSQNLEFIGDFHHPHICWKRDRHGWKQSRRLLECVGINPFMLLSQGSLAMLRPGGEAENAKAKGRLAVKWLRKIVPDQTDFCLALCPVGEGWTLWLKSGVWQSPMVSLERNWWYMNWINGRGWGNLLHHPAQRPVINNMKLDGY